MKSTFWAILPLWIVVSVVWTPEACAGPDVHRLAQLKNADTDGDKRVSFDEFMGAFPQLDRSAFDVYDKNEDGFLSRADFAETLGEHSESGTGLKSRMLTLLQKADADGNREVTFDEINAVAPQITRQQFERFDRNSDGVISKADSNANRPSSEKGGKLRDIAVKADKDGNGQVTFEELQAEIPGITQERFARFDRNGDGVLSQADQQLPERRSSGENRDSGAQITRKVLQADKDGDGKVTYEEVTAMKPGFPRTAFDRFDSNNDGVLSEEDVAKESTE